MAANPRERRSVWLVAGARARAGAVTCGAAATASIVGPPGAALRSARGSSASLRSARSTTSLRSARGSARGSAASLRSVVERERPLSASASGTSLRSYNSLAELERPLPAEPQPYEALGALKKTLGVSFSSTDLASSPYTLASSRSRSREDLTSPVDWPGTEFGGRRTEI